MEWKKIEKSERKITKLNREIENVNQEIETANQENKGCCLIVVVAIVVFVAGMCYLNGGSEKIFPAPTATTEPVPSGQVIELELDNSDSYIMIEGNKYVCRPTNNGFALQDDDYYHYSIFIKNNSNFEWWEETWIDNTHLFFKNCTVVVQKNTFPTQTSTPMPTATPLAIIE